MITYDTEHRPEVANFLDIASGFTGATPEELAIRLGSGGGRALKELVTEAVNEGLRGHRELRTTYAADPAQLRRIRRTHRRRHGRSHDAHGGARAMSMDY